MTEEKYRESIRLITLLADGVTVGVKPPNFLLLLFGVPIVVLTCNNEWFVVVFIDEIANGGFLRVE